MAITIEFNAGGAQFATAAQGLQAVGKNVVNLPALLGPILAVEIRKFLVTIAKQLGATHGRSWPGGTTNGSLSRRTGTLISEMAKSVAISGSTIGNVTGTIKVPANYVMQETGGIIRAKNTTYLAIPTEFALTSNGTPILNSPRDWGNTFVAKSKRGNLIIFQRRGKDAIPLYVLKTEVNIPPRLGLERALRNGTSAFVTSAQDAMLRAMLERL